MICGITDTVYLDARIFDDMMMIRVPLVEQEVLTLPEHEFAPGF
jgi:hypothetical protein